MWHLNTATVKKSTYALVIFVLYSLPALAQQWVIENKNNTHPEIKTLSTAPAFITAFNVERWNGYNEISWTALRELDTRKYIIEYSTNGIDYQTAGEVLTNNDGYYTFKHQLLDPRPLIYRIKLEQANNKFFYAEGMPVDGIHISPVQIYPTIIQGNTININAYWPIERVIITSGSGQQVFAKDINGQRDLITIVIPNFGRGMYWITSYGHGWKTTTKFIMS